HQPPAVHLRRRPSWPGNRPGRPELLRGHPRPYPTHVLGGNGPSRPGRRRSRLLSGRLPIISAKPALPAAPAPAGRQATSPLRNRHRRRMAEMTDGHPRPQRPLEAATQRKERPVLPTGALRRTSRLAVLPLRHAARTAATASRLSRAASDQVAARTAEQLFATLGELKGGAAKLGQ